MPKLESDLLQSLESGRDGGMDGGEVQRLEVSTRGRARGGAGTLLLWLSSQGPAPAWGAGSR